MAPFDRPARGRHRGCLGCLAQSALALLLGCVLVYALFAVLAPWNFYFGGHFHLVPGWTGHAWIRAPQAGGNYFLRLTFNPTTPGYRKSPLKGTAYLCTPRGERFRLHFGGGMPRQHGADLRGLPIHLYFYNWPVFGGFAGERRPAFDLYGTFGNSELNMDDRGSLARAFRPDATLVGPRDHWPWNQPGTHVTLQEDSGWVFSPSCPAAPG